MKNFLAKYGVFFAGAIALTLIIWSYVEPDFYSYVEGNGFLIWTAYILPWVIIVAVLASKFKWIDKIRDKFSK